MYVKTQLSDLIGKTFVSVETIGDEEVRFIQEDGSYYRLHHEQDCCENVYIEDIEGNVSSLAGNPILIAEEVNNDLPPLNQYEESYTWTFYKFATINGHVDIRWYGSSNGYYSESVHFDFVVNKNR